MQGRYVYLVSEESILFCFNAESAKLEHVVKASAAPPIHTQTHKCATARHRRHHHHHHTTTNEHSVAMQVHEKDVLGLAHHPHRNILASFSGDGTIKLWKP